VSDYLFDKEGEPDPEVERLESLLAPMAFRGAAPRLPVKRARRTFVVAAAMAAMAAGLVALLIAKPWRPRPRHDETTTQASWAATVRDGAATSDGRALAGATRLLVGAWLETGSSHVRLAVADIGTVELAPQTRARIVATSATRHELRLERGTLVATIDAPPRHFVVTTPRAVVTDLGCAFELTVDESGRGRLVVTAGKVAVTGSDAREVVVDAGARVDLSERGPGAPYVPHAEAPQPPQPPAPPPIAPHAAKPPHHATHIKSAPPAAPPPIKTKIEHAQPPRKEPTKIEHDALKDLKNSVE
jgi:ferric-dicitrate binding protein FerR (iron transport regulator)